MEITKSIMQEIITDAKTATTHYEVRKAIFNHCKRSDIVPETLINPFRKITRHCYSSVSHETLVDGTVRRYHNAGYDGIMTEIDDRLALKLDNNDEIIVADFFKAPGNKVDIYDSFRKQGYERKTGTGTWLYGTGSFEDIVKAYRRKRRLLVWDYVHEPKKGRKNDNPIDIHICTTFRLFFDYLSTYPTGINTFFKYKVGRSATAGIEMYDIQTIHNSRKKIEFLENFDSWLLNQQEK